MRSVAVTINKRNIDSLAFHIDFSAIIYSNSVHCNDLYTAIEES